MTQIVLIHGGESTATKLAAALPGARVAVVYRQGLSAVYDENTGIAKEYPTLRGLLQVFAPEWKPGEPLVVLGYSAGAWALRYYLRDPAARSDVTAAVFLDGLYGAPGGVCNMAPYQGVLAYAKEANANPASKRLVMTYSKSHPGPDVCSEEIKAAAPGPAVFTVPANNADHGAQQGVVGPAVVKDLIAPWIGGSSSSTAVKKNSLGWLLGGALLVAGVWYVSRQKSMAENPRGVDVAAARDEMWVYLQSLQFGTEQMQRQLKHKLDATVRRVAKRTGRTFDDVWGFLESEAKKEGSMRA